MNDYRCQNCGLSHYTYARICDGCGETLHNVEARHESHPEVKEEFRMIYRCERVEHPRILSALWFACAGSIPTIVIWFFLLWRDPYADFIFSWIAILPTALATFYGSCLGARIVDPAKVVTSFGAFWRGLLIAFLSFITLITALSLLGDELNFHEFFRTFVFLLFFGSILAGWEVLIVGGLAGWFLYTRYRSPVLTLR